MTCLGEKIKPFLQKFFWPEISNSFTVKDCYLRVSRFYFLLIALFLFANKISKGRVKRLGG